jgi:type II secretory pathway pseudopilin PulG
MRKWNVERGMSLVEATIILLTLSVLTAVVAPSITDYVNDARSTKVKEDTEAIGLAIARVVRDTGVSCLITGTPSTKCDVDTRVDVLVSEGADPTSDTGNDYDVPADSATNTTYNWAGSTAYGVVPAGNKGTMAAQFITNGPAYTSISAATQTFTPPSTQVSGFGWRGPYVSAIGADPWGYKYQANTIFLSVANDATAASGTEGAPDGGWHRDVFVLSSGPDGVVSTPFATDDLGTKALGDDLIYTVQGTTN